MDYEKERLEAIEAGEKALESLQEAENCLSKARKWGVVDILGGGLISSLVKHSKMDDAQEYIEAAKEDLRSFRKELKDVQMISDINLETSDFLGVADVIFDGFLSDVFMQDRIKEAQVKLTETIGQVKYALRQLGYNGEW